MYLFFPSIIVSSKNSINPPKSLNQAASLSTEYSALDQLTVASRCQGNFLENVPLAFLIKRRIEFRAIVI